MKTIGAYEAKTRLSALLDDVERGEKITITKNGRPVAVLLPPSGITTGLDEVVQELRNFGRKNKIGRTTIKSLIEDGRE